MEAITAIEDTTKALINKIQSTNEQIVQLNNIKQYINRAHIPSSIEGFAPVNSILYLKGHVEHPNTFIVNLGSNTYIERTAAECIPIINRRIVYAKSHISQLVESTIENEQTIEIKPAFINDESKDNEGIVDIIEEYDSEGKEITSKIEAKPVESKQSGYSAMPIQEVKAESSSSAGPPAKMSLFMKQRLAKEKK